MSPTSGAVSVSQSPNWSEDWSLPGLWHREQLRGEAELELSEVPDTRYNVDDGIDLLLKNLDESFGERPPFRQIGVICEYDMSPLGASRARASQPLFDASGCWSASGCQRWCQGAICPQDAHYQLGKAERHGQAVKHIMQRLVNQSAATTAYEMQMLANMACFAKNSLARRSGASPCCQWAHGRNSILSEPDAIEAKQVIEDSEPH